MDMTEKRQKALEEAQRFFENGLEMVKELSTGAAETKTCEKYGVNTRSFRNFLFNPKWGYKEGDPDKMQEEMQEELQMGLLFNGYERLYCTLIYYRGCFGNQYPIFDEEYYNYLPEWKEMMEREKIRIPSDCDERMKKAISNLPEDEQKVLEARYLRGRNYSIREISEGFGKKEDWILRRERDAFQHLRSYDNFVYIKYSAKEIEEELERRKRNTYLPWKLREERLEEIGNLLDLRKEEIRKKDIKDIEKMMKELREIKKELGGK